MVNRLWVPGPLPGMNDIIEDNRIARRGRRKDGKAALFTKYGEVKKRWNSYITTQVQAQRFRRIDKPSHFTFLCYEQNRQRDPDNFCAGARKVILDALQAAKTLENDGWKEVLGLHEYWEVRKDKPGVVLYVTSGHMTREQAFLLEEQYRNVRREKQRAKASRRANADEAIQEPH